MKNKDIVKYFYEVIVSENLLDELSGTTMQDKLVTMIWREQYIDYLFQNMWRGLH